MEFISKLLKLAETVYFTLLKDVQLKVSMVSFECSVLSLWTKNPLGIILCLAWVSSSRFKKFQANPMRS
jgi:hypothetical protein